MTIHEIAEKFNLSLQKARRMQRAGILIVTGSDSHPLAAAMRANLVRGQALSVPQIFALLDAPETFAELRGRQGEARAQIAALGDFEADKPAPVIIGQFVAAADRDPQARKACIAWLKSILPIEPVEHAWLAVRLAQGMAENAREIFLGRLGRALHYIREDPDFAGWHSERLVKGAKRKIYFRPRVFSFDL